MLPRACSTRARAGLLTQVVAHKRKLAQRVEEAHAAEQEALERARAFEQRRRETREAAQREQDALAALAKVSSPTHPPSYARASGLEASLPACSARSLSRGLSRLLAHPSGTVPPDAGEGGGGQGEEATDASGADHVRCVYSPRKPQAATPIADVVLYTA